ncbi:Uncharacterised protein [uncultured archaeon]|nr:Uncharacterised protein [uncultured archaeon]
MAKVCIICEKEKSGHPVADDIVISTIRWFKNKTNTAKNNTLVVCNDCLPEHKKKREKFEKNLVTHVVLAAIVLLLLFFLPLIAGAGISLTSLLLGLVLAILIIAFAGIYHWPRTTDGAEKLPAAQAKVPEKEEEKKGKKK